MPSYSVAEAKNRLPSLIDQALEGEEVVITRHGKPVAEIRPRRRLTPDERKALYQQMAAEAAEHPIEISTLELIREERDAS